MAIEVVYLMGTGGIVQVRGISGVGVQPEGYNPMDTTGGGKPRPYIYRMGMVV